MDVPREMMSIQERCPWTEGSQATKNEFVNTLLISCWTKTDACTCVSWTWIGRHRRSSMQYFGGGSSAFNCQNCSVCFTAAGCKLLPLHHCAILLTFDSIAVCFDCAETNTCQCIPGQLLVVSSALQFQMLPLFHMSMQVLPSAAQTYSLAYIAI